MVHSYTKIDKIFCTSEHYNNSISNIIYNLKLGKILFWSPNFVKKLFFVPKLCKEFFQ